MHSRVMTTASMSLPAVALCAVAVLACTKSRPPRPLPPLNMPGSTLPIHYKKDLVIARRENSLFVMDFTRSDKRGGVVTYRYRQLIRGDSKERTGNGELHEEWFSVPIGKIKNPMMILRQLPFKEGDPRVNWSKADEKGGYLYFDPRSLTLQTKRGEQFRSFDEQRLNHFVKRQSSGCPDQDYWIMHRLTWCTWPAALPQSALPNSLVGHAAHGPRRDDDS